MGVVKVIVGFFMAEWSWHGGVVVRAMRHEGKCYAHDSDRLHLWRESVWQGGWMPGGGLNTVLS